PRLSFSQSRFKAQHLGNISRRSKQAQYLFIVAEKLCKKRMFEDRDAHASNIEKDSFFLALQVNIEMINATLTLTNQCLRPAAMFDACKDRVLCIRIGFIGKIHP